jgi:calcineurin-like phosphoesterase family protein
MDAALIEFWNATVGTDDEVWHLGDFALGRTEAAMAALLARLNGRKHLVAGNNDGAATWALAGWASVGPYAEVTCAGTLMVLCHYPFRSWRDMARGSINLHGHCHGKQKPLPRQLDVGVDVWDFRPVTAERIIAAAKGRAASPRLATPRR